MISQELKDLIYKNLKLIKIFLIINIFLAGYYLLMLYLYALHTDLELAKEIIMNFGSLIFIFAEIFMYFIMAISASYFISYIFLTKKKK